MTAAFRAPGIAFDRALLARIEDAGINASAPRQQRWVDGWLVRFSPGKAKRARCIQAVAPGQLSIEDKLARCQPVYAAAGLPLFVRITPFSEPAGLDERLAGLGMRRLDETRVMVVSSLDAISRGASLDEASLPLPGGVRLEAVQGEPFAEWVGETRGGDADERRAHAERIVHSPVPHHAMLAIDRHGVAVAGGQVTIEGDVAGLYDIVTAESHRGRGMASALCRTLLQHAMAAGARIGYLQVDAGNEPAIRLYRRLGFEDAYAYHYRTPVASP